MQAIQGDAEEGDAPELQVLHVLLSPCLLLLAQAQFCTFMVLPRLTDQGSFLHSPTHRHPPVTSPLVLLFCTSLANLLAGDSFAALKHACWDTVQQAQAFSGRARRWHNGPGHL